MRRHCAVAWMTVVLAAAAFGAKKEKAPVTTPLDDYIRDSQARGVKPAAPNSGSLWNAQAPLGDMARDPRAQFVDDMVTVLVVERASAVSSGGVSSQRKSSAKASVNALGGLTKAKGPLTNLANLSGDSSLDGAASTKRATTLDTTLAGRVTHVLPNGYMVIEASKEVQVNSEKQMVTVRGIARSADISNGNIVRSDHLAQLEVRVNGKGIVGDAVRRPFFLYRLLMGVLPF